MVINVLKIEQAEAGDIVAVAGLSDISVGETLCDNTIFYLCHYYILMSQRYR